MSSFFILRGHIDSTSVTYFCHLKEGYQKFVSELVFKKKKKMQEEKSQVQVNLKLGHSSPCPRKSRNIVSLPFFFHCHQICLNLLTYHNSDKRVASTLHPIHSFFKHFCLSFVKHSTCSYNMAGQITHRARHLD